MTTSLKIQKASKQNKLTNSQYDNIEIKLSFLQRKLSECDTVFEQLKLKMISHKDEISTDDNYINNLESKLKRRLTTLPTPLDINFHQWKNMSQGIVHHQSQICNRHYTQMI